MESGYSLRLVQKPESCAFCRLRHFCLPRSLSHDQVRKLESLAKHAAVFNKRQRIFDQDSSFTACYAVKSGSVKTVHVDSLGQEKVMEFYLPGDLFGFDGICNGKHTGSAVALERSLICKINFRELEESITHFPELQYAIFQLISQEMNTAQELLRYLTQNSAEERVVRFLLDVGQRYKRRGLSENILQLPMTRSDVASYLGLAIETVSRIFSRLQHDNLIEQKGREVTLLDRPAMLAMLPTEYKPLASRFS